MISVEHMDELIQRFNSGELDIRDIIEQSYLAGSEDAIDEFVKKAIKKQEALFINPSVSEQMQFKCFLYVIAEQLKGNKE